MSTPAAIDFCMAGEEVIELERTADAGSADAQHKERLGEAVLPRAEGKVVMGPLRRLPARPPGLGALGAIPETAVHPAPVSWRLEESF